MVLPEHRQAMETKIRELDNGMAEFAAQFYEERIRPFIVEYVALCENHQMDIDLVDYYEVGVRCWEDEYTDCSDDDPDAVDITDAGDQDGLFRNWESELSEGCEATRKQPAYKAMVRQKRALQDYLEMVVYVQNRVYSRRRRARHFLENVMPGVIESGCPFDSGVVQQAERIVNSG